MNFYFHFGWYLWVYDLFCLQEFHEIDGVSGLDMYQYRVLEIIHDATSMSLLTYFENMASYWILFDVLMISNDTPEVDIPLSFCTHGWSWPWCLYNVVPDKINDAILTMKSNQGLVAPFWSLELVQYAPYVRNYEHLPTKDGLDSYASSASSDELLVTL